MTVRDWLPIVGAFLIPIMVALGTGWITWQLAKLENQRAQQAQKIENRRAEAERELARERAQDEALQAYLSQMGSLLLEKDLRESAKDSEERTLARARTLTVLGRLDTSRKEEVMQFLVEADLVQGVDGRDPIIGLSGADLSNTKGLAQANLEGANLSEANLRDADLTQANLRDADLSGANLSGASLSFADLRGARVGVARLRVVSGDFVQFINADLSDADLTQANLRDANLTQANLSNADLSGADLSNADLREANLSNADLSFADLSGAILRDANLRHANLYGVQGVTNEELAQQAASLKGATMINDQKYGDWLQSILSEQGGKNDGSP
jgi:uncharacterized protein YjbI with pentapeptide repeats